MNTSAYSSSTISHFVDNLHAWPVILVILLKQLLNTIETILLYLYRTGAKVLKAHYNFCKQRELMCARCAGKRPGLSNPVELPEAVKISASDLTPSRARLDDMFKARYPSSINELSY